MQDGAGARVFSDGGCFVSDPSVNSVKSVVKISLGARLRRAMPFEPFAAIPSASRICGLVTQNRLNEFCWRWIALSPRRSENNAIHPHF